ncbi:MAG TPA: hypothetical protein VLW85_23715 [Myxococcales bacterium]|nr:hypothetical protein [Myxococcales bacterium]
MLIALTTLTLVLPALTTTTPGPGFSTSQLAFAGGSSLALYGVFLFVQIVRHREDFLEAGDDAGDEAPPSHRRALVSLGVLLAALVAVVALAKLLSPAIESGVAAIGAPAPVVGIAISLLVLLPEIWSVMKLAARNRVQTGLNLALGSGLSTIGLTIPAVAAASIFAGLPLALGLPPKEAVLLAVTLLISVVTFAGGRTTILHGAVHLVVFAAFLFLSVVP